MRLICPNCDAQYEVPDEVMPAAGRDVQCSNCGQTWFQHHPDNEPLDPEEDWPAEDDSPPAAPEKDPEAFEAEPEDPKAAATAGEPQFPNLRAAAGGKPQPEATEARQPATQPEPADAPDDPAPAAPAAAPSRRQLDPAVAEILRQEAAAEQEARRRRQSEPLESQPELGLDQDWPEPDSDEEEIHDDDEDSADGDSLRDMSAERRAYEARVRMARMRGEPDPVDPAGGADAGPRRNLLPDIEEINSTLRHEREGGTRAGPTPTAAQDAPVRERSSGGFMRGFVLMIALAAVLALVYAYAPQIAQSLPQADPYLSSYVAAMDDARIWLDRQLQALLVWLDTMAAQSQP